MNNLYEKGEFFTSTQVTMFQQLELICCFRPHGIVEMNFETFKADFAFFFACLFVCVLKVGNKVNGCCNKKC